MSKQEWEEQVKILVEEIGTKTRLAPGQNGRIFDLHNEGVLQKWLRAPMEYGRSCNACVLRVFKRLQKYLIDKE
jgi:hypothetical protein